MFERMFGRYMKPASHGIAIIFFKFAVQREVITGNAPSNNSCVCCKCRSDLWYTVIEIQNPATGHPLVKLGYNFVLSCKAVFVKAFNYFAGGITK